MPIKTIIRNSDNLIVCFASIKGKTEFYRTFEELNYSTIYIIDNDRSWFSNNEFGTTMIERGQYLQNEIQKVSFSKLMFTGLSMGGSGAILYAHYLKPNKVVVFSPQIDLTHGNVTKFKENIKHKQLNLINMISDYNVKTDIHIGENESQGKNYWGDLHHANLLTKFKCVNIIQHQGVYEHTPASALKKANKLNQIFEFD